MDRVHVKIVSSILGTWLHNCTDATDHTYCTRCTKGVITWSAILFRGCTFFQASSLQAKDTPDGIFFFFSEYTICLSLSLSPSYTYTNALWHTNQNTNTHCCLCAPCATDDLWGRDPIESIYNTNQTGIQLVLFPTFLPLLLCESWSL